MVTDTGARMGGAGAGVLAALLGCRDRDDYDEDGFVEPEDCDDNDPEAWPGAEERPYDLVDQDCDGFDLVDWDADGWDAASEGGADCNDQDPRVFPGARDVPYDGVDADCDAWSDDDFDHDGFDARGHGGEDCDDRDAALIPLDLDGDGYSPCTGDCDDGDPRRNEAEPPVCGNEIDDDCDGVGDCALIGFFTVDDADLHLRARARDGVRDLGMALAFVEGPGGAFLAVTDRDDVAGDDGLPLETPTHLELVPAPLDPADPAVRLDARVARYEVSGDAVSLWPAPRGELLVGAPGFADEGRSAVTRIRMPTAAERYPDLVVVEIRGPWEDRLGEAASPLGAGLAIGAPGHGDGAVAVIPGDLRGARAFGEDGALLVGPAGSYTGRGVHGFDADADGVDDLAVAGTGERPGLWIVHAPPLSGQARVDELADFTVDTARQGILDPWRRVGTAMASGDLDGDGIEDLVVGAPDYDGQLGAVVALPRLASLEDGMHVSDAPVQLYALGDDSLGEALVVADLDSDGVDDLIVGGPATNAGGGGAVKPGATYVWYGPLEDQVEHSLSADLYLAGVTTDLRTLSGRSLAVGDLSGDGLPDLAIATPWYEFGRVDVLLGGWSAEHGF